MAILALADTWPVPAGAVSLPIAGIYPLPYQVKATTTWLTTIDSTGKTSLEYTLEFATPAPPNAFVDVVVVNE